MLSIRHTINSKTWHKGMKKMYHANTIHKKAGIALLIAYIVDFRAGILPRIKTE